LERITLPALAEGIKKCEAIGIIAVDVSAVIAPVEHVVDQAIIDRAREASHGSEHTHGIGTSQ
jgi:hypothetical protein